MFSGLIPIPSSAKEIMTLSFILPGGGGQRTTAPGSFEGIFVNKDEIQ